MNHTVQIPSHRMTDCAPSEITSAQVLATVLQLVHIGPELVRGMIQVAGLYGEPCRFAVSFHAVFFQTFRIQTILLSRCMQHLHACSHNNHF